MYELLEEQHTVEDGQADKLLLLLNRDQAHPVFKAFLIFEVNVLSE
jgi:hypothetical protein